MKYYDYCGIYEIKQREDGAYTVYHRLASYLQKVVKVGAYKTIRGSKIALAKYCGGMPKVIDK